MFKQSAQSIAQARDFPADATAADQKDLISEGIETFYPSPNFCRFRTGPKRPDFRRD
jgi:hypothetical protein